MKQIKNAGILMILVASMISFQSNAQQKNTDDILKDTLKKEQIMTAIGNNPEMRMEMMEKMMKMTEKDTTMSKMMMEKMMMKMEKDTTMSKKMKVKMATMKKEKGMKCDCECEKENKMYKCKKDEVEKKDDID